MCLAVPVKVIKVLNETTLVVESGGVNLDVSSVLVPGIKAGDYVLLHAGFAIQKMTEAEAMETLSIIAGD